MTKQETAIKYIQDNYLAFNRLRHDIVSDKLQIRLSGDRAPQKSADFSGTPLAKGEGQEYWCEMSKHDINSIVCHAAQEYDANITSREVMTALQSDLIPDVHPLREYVLSCREWTEEQPDWIDMVAQQVTVRPSPLSNSLENAASGYSLEAKGKEKHPCFLCSWYRRKALFDVAQELGCNKIALGHNKDDLVETLLMNLIFQGSMSTIPPLLQMEKMPIQMIRPLCLIEEKDITQYAELSGYQKQTKLCPLEKVSSRAEVKQLLSQLEALNPNVRDSIWSAMENIKSDYLPRKAQR